MANEKQTTKTTTDYSAISATWGAKLGENEAWQYARKELARKLDEAENEPFGKFFESKSTKNGGDFSAQVLSAILLTSVGNINAKYEKAKMKALEAGDFNKQSFIEGFITDTLCPTLAEERAKREAELAKERAERIALRDSVLRAVESVRDSWDDAGLEPSLELVKKACERKLGRDEAKFAQAFCARLASEVLTSDEVNTLFKTLGFDFGFAILPLLIDENGNLPADNAEEDTDEVTDEAEDVTPEVNVD